MIRYLGSVHSKKTALNRSKLAASAARLQRPAGMHQSYVPSHNYFLSVMQGGS